MNKKTKIKKRKIKTSKRKMKKKQTIKGGFIFARKKKEPQDIYSEIEKISTKEEDFSAYNKSKCLNILNEIAKKTLNGYIDKNANDSINFDSSSLKDKNTVDRIYEELKTCVPEKIYLDSFSPILVGTLSDKNKYFNEQLSNKNKNRNKKTEKIEPKNREMCKNIVNSVSMKGLNKKLLNENGEQMKTKVIKYTMKDLHNMTKLLNGFNQCFPKDNNHKFLPFFLTKL